MFVAAIFLRAKGMLVTMEPSFRTTKCIRYLRVKQACKCTAEMSLFQFGFSRKKRHGGESDEGNSSEEGRRAKEKK